MLLEGRNAVIYGASGGIGSTAARAFAREGAHVFLAGRTQETLDAVAEDIRVAGGKADTAIVDALDKDAVDAHADSVAAQGGIDVSLNVITHSDVQGTPLVDMTLDDFMAPVVTGLNTNFLTATAAGRHMRERGKGVILMYGGSGAPLRDYDLGGLQVGLTAIDVLGRQLAAELGKHGVRVMTILTAGVFEGFSEVFEGAEAIIDQANDRSMLHQTATYDDVGNALVFAASDWARTMTCTQLNISCGSEMG